MIRIIFILPNIYESVNGVSLKYIKFIEFLNRKNISVTVFTTFKKKEIYENLTKHNNLTVIKTKGISIPFYQEIKIPIIKESKLLEEIKTNNEIIIFNGEFIWLYEILKNVKIKYKNIKIYPTMHTDYIFYGESVYSKFKFYNFNFTSLLNHLDHYLEKKIYDGIIVTGEKMKEKYLKYTNSIFNANEINLEVFNVNKKDLYDNNIYNIIYCGRISKEKNIEELLDCCLLLSQKKYDFTLNIIGDGPYLENLKDIVHLKYSLIKLKIIFHGNKNQNEINNLYNLLENRIFLFTSISETFGKTPMEAGCCGIPIFIKSCDVSDSLYINKKNAFLFKDKDDFINLFEHFINLHNFEKNIFISNSIDNIKKYDQKIIFENWYNFLTNGSIEKKYGNIHLNIFDIFTFHGITKFINCSGSILSD